MRGPPTEEEALDWKPPAKVARPAALRVLDVKTAPFPAADASTKKTPRLYAVDVPAPMTKVSDWINVDEASLDPRVIRFPEMVVEFAAEPTKRVVEVYTFLNAVP